MSKITTRKFAIYNTLQAALRRSGCEKSGSLATLLLETFIQNGGILTKSTVEKAGLCEEGGFKAWREPLIKAGWIQYDHTLAKAMQKGSQHQPGRLLVPYINKETAKTHQFATKHDVDEMAVNYANLESRIQALETAFDSLIERVDPPTSPEKRRYYTENPIKLSLRVM